MESTFLYNFFKSNYFCVFVTYINNIAEKREENIERKGKEIKNKNSNAKSPTSDSHIKLLYFKWT